MTPILSEGGVTIWQGDARARPIIGMTALLRFEPPRQTTAAVVASILRVCFPGARTALDLTPGRGCFWRDDVPINVSVEASPHDFRCLPYADDSFDVALLDPPHNADAGARSIDVVHQVRSHALVDGRWLQPQLSARNNGSSYLVFRRDGLKHIRQRLPMP